MNCKPIKCKTVFMSSVVILSKGMGFGDMISSFFSIFWFLITFSMSINCFRFFFDYAKENRVFILFSLFGRIRTAWRSLFPNCFVTMNNSNEILSVQANEAFLIIFFFCPSLRLNSLTQWLTSSNPKMRRTLLMLLLKRRQTLGMFFCIALHIFHSDLSESKQLSTMRRYLSQKIFIANFWWL